MFNRLEVFPAPLNSSVVFFKAQLIFMMILFILFNITLLIVT